MLPNTFILGAQKSGTTALHHLLGLHPDIFFPRAPQEIHFFDVENNYRKGMRWYEPLFSEWSGQRVVAQTSPLYFFEPAVPGRIKQVLPDARLIVILRNPVDRAYSQYWHEVKHGSEKLTFEEALKCEPERLLKGFESRRRHSYASRGEYAIQFARYLEHFPRERILALRFDDLMNDVDEIFRRCANFLEVPLEGFDRARLGPKVRNAARMPRSRLVQVVGRRLGRVFPAMNQVIARFNFRQTKYPKMAAETRRELQDRFEAEIRETGSLTGLDLQAWLKSESPARSGNP